MHEMLPVLATRTAQAIAAGVVAGLLYAFFRRYRKSYVLHWTLGWSALAVYHIATVGAMALHMSGVSAVNPAGVAARFAAGMAGYLAVGWLLFGVFELVNRRPVRLAAERHILIALGVIGLLSFAYTSFPDSRGFAADGVRSIVCAAAYVSAAVWLWRSRARIPGTGAYILACAFVAYAFAHIQYAVLVVLALARAEAPQVSTILVNAGFVIQSIMAIGMIACLLESEREAANLAVVEFEYLAYYDALTGLPNRPLFLDRLIVAMAHASRTSHKLAVLFVDLDRFKEINDSMGHTAGDSLLKAVAARLRQCVRDSDTISRFGGDEFTLLLPQLTVVEDAAHVAAKINEVVKAPFMIQDNEVFVTASIGISTFPDDATNAEALVRNADAAMYRVKDRGRDGYHLYAPAMNARAVERISLEKSLRTALAQHELIIHYQPIIDAQTNSIVGVEALLRWRNPRLGFLLPGSFLPVAEDSSLIVPIGEWVLSSACKQIKAWHEKIDFDMMLAVNLSQRQFEQADLIERVASVLKESGLNPGSLELEISETTAMRDPENTLRILRELKELGVQIAIDDFGTGFSSLIHLKRFPIDTLKLDRTFIAGVTTERADAALVGAVIALAHSLEVKVVAEGVQSKDQVAFLRRQRCDRIQGFDFSMPLPPEELEPQIMQWRVASAEA